MRRSRSATVRATPATPPAQTAAMSSVPVRISTHLQTPVIPGPLQPLYYYGTTNSATTDASHGGKRYNAKSGDCRHRAYEGDYRCTACGGTVKGETGDFRHSGPLELRDVRTATCTERGYSGNQYCTSCDRIAHKGVSTPSLHEIADNCKLINEVKPGCTTSGYSGDQQCTAGCGQIIRYGHVVNKLSHDWDGGKPAKQGKSEGILYTCQRADCGETRFVKNSATTGYIVTVIKGTASVAAGTLITDKIAQNTVVTVTADAPEAGKVFDKWVVLEGNVTLADVTKATTTFTMPGNDVKLDTTYKDASPSHTHSYGTEWKYDDTDHWHECECGDKTNIAAHSASEWIVDTAATETADGAKHKECTVCKKVLETAPIPATGSNHTHSYGTEWKYDGTNHWHECECGDKADTAPHSFQWVIDKRPLPRRPPASNTRNAPFAAPSAARIRSSTSSPTAATPTIQAAVIITPISQEMTTPPSVLRLVTAATTSVGWLLCTSAAAF